MSTTSIQSLITACNLRDRDERLMLADELAYAGPAWAEEEALLRGEGEVTYSPILGSVVPCHRLPDHMGGVEFVRDGRVHFVGDGGHKGTELYYSDRLRKWVVVSHERASVRLVDNIAAVTLGDVIDEGLNQFALACDLECQGGLWIIDADDLDRFDDDSVEVLFVEEDE